MTEAELRRIERTIELEHDPGFTYWVEACRALTAEVRRCGGPWERIEAGAKAWDDLQKAKR